MALKGSDNLVCVAMITAVHGIKGAVKVKSFTSKAQDFIAYGNLLDASGKRLFQMELLNQIKDVFLVQIKGVSDRDTAEALRGTKLYVPREKLPKPEAEEFYYTDLIGMAVLTPEKEIIGCVKAIYNFGAGDMLEIEKPDLSTVLVAFTKRVVPKIDLDAKTLTVCVQEELDVSEESESLKNG